VLLVSAECLFFGQVSRTHLTVSKWSPNLNHWLSHNCYFGLLCVIALVNLVLKQMQINCEFHTQIFSKKWLTFIFLCMLNWNTRKCFDKKRIKKKLNIEFIFSVFLIVCENVLFKCLFQNATGNIAFKSTLTYGKQKHSEKQVH